LCIFTLEEEGDNVFDKADFSSGSNLVIGVGGSISLNQCDGRSSIIIFILDCKSCVEIRLSIDSRIFLLISPTKFNVHLSGFAISSSRIGEINVWRLSKKTDYNLIIEYRKKKGKSPRRINDI